MRDVSRRYPRYILEYAVEAVVSILAVSAAGGRSPLRVPMYVLAGAFAWAFASSGPLLAQVYKCQGGDGRVAYSSTPCEAVSGQKALGQVRVPGATIARAAEPPASAPATPGSAPEPSGARAGGAPSADCRSLQMRLSQMRRDAAAQTATDGAKRAADTQRITSSIAELLRSPGAQACAANGEPLDSPALKADADRRHCLALFTELEIARFRQTRGEAGAADRFARAAERMKRDRCSFSPADYPDFVMRF